MEVRSDPSSRSKTISEDDYPTSKKMSAPFQSDNALSFRVGECLMAMMHSARIPEGTRTPRSVD